MADPLPLKRALGLTALTLYGVGVIVGAGIYVLVGKIAGLAGNAAWLAFLGAAVAALPTGLSYAELASRYPRSAGEAVFAHRATGQAALAFLVGFLVLASGIVSTATLSHGFAHYFTDLFGGRDAWHVAALLAFLAGLSWLNHRGIREAAWVNGICTVASVGALLVLVALGVGSWGSVDLLDATPPPSAAGSGTLLAAVALAFYAFIGFEDICNVAEEVRSPHRTIPRAILLSLVISTGVYVAVGVTVVSVVPVAELVESAVPLVTVAERLLPDVSASWLSVIALLAVTNSALFNLIMCSRICFGMGRDGWFPGGFAKVHPTRQTPTWGVVAAFVLTVVAALTGVLQVLAEATNVIILTVFSCVNAALLVVKVRRVPADDPGSAFFAVPIWVPVIGLVTTLWILAQFSGGAYTRAGVVLLLGLGLFAIRRFAGAGDAKPMGPGA